MSAFRVLDCSFTVSAVGYFEVEEELQRIFRDLDVLREDEPATSFELAVEGERAWLFQDGDRVASATQPSWLLDVLVWSVNRELARRTEFMLLHGAAVTRDGRAILLPGASGAGKSSLAAALVQDGWDLLSDELIAIDGRTGAVHGTGLPINLKRNSWFLVPPDLVTRDVERKPSGQLLVRPTEMGGRHATRPSAVSAVLAPRFGATEPTRLDDLTRGQALFRLADACLNPMKLRLGRLAEVVRSAWTYQIFYDSPRNAVEALSPLLEAVADGRSPGPLRRA